MGKGRVRIDPAALPELMCWLIAWRQPLERTSRLTIRGLKGPRRAKVLGVRRWATGALKVVDMVVDGLTRTGNAQEFDEALTVFLGTLSEQPAGGK